MTSATVFEVLWRNNTAMLPGMAIAKWLYALRDAESSRVGAAPVV